MEKKTLYLIDASGFIFRAYHALPPLTNVQGQPTGAVFGFSNMLIKLLDEAAPTFLAAVFDTGKPTFRQILFEGYKANRPPPPEDLVPQFFWIDEIVKGFRIPILRADGFEADDIIATLTVRALDSGLEEVVIVSSDKDLMQLANERVTLLDTMKNMRYGPAEIKAKFGVGPELLGDWLALCGDSVDNIPGVPGVGPKTATKLLEEFGSLENILQQADKKISGLKLKQSLIENTNQARLSRKLLELNHQCPLTIQLDQLQRQEPDQARLGEIFRELGFSKLQQRLTLTSEPTLDRSRYRAVLSEEELRKYLVDIRAAGRCAIDLETTSLNPVNAKIVGISLCWAAGHACYIPISHIYLGNPKQLDLNTVLESLRPILTDASFPKYGQNYKFDWMILKRAQLVMEGITNDPMLASYVLDPSRNSHGLDTLALEYLRHTMISYKEALGNLSSFEEVEVERATEYSAEDAEATFLLSDILAQRLKQEPDMADLLQKLELPLARVLGEMELKGVMIDTLKLQSLSSQVGKQLENLDLLIKNEAGWDININSPKQLQKLLFEDLHLTRGRKTKNGFSTDAEVLADLALEHPIVAQIEEYRTLSKLKNTYLDALPKLVLPETGRVHTSYNQAVAATGRLTSSEPNLQNIPVRTELGRQIRAAFIAPEGRVILSADYSQIELRILAHLSKDPVLLEAFRQGQDVHLRTAIEVFGLPAEHITPEHRRIAKAVNFGVIYGQSDWGLSRQLRIPQASAKQYIDSYFARHAGVKCFMDDLIEQARRNREVRTLLGRRRPIPDIVSSKASARNYAERIARNTPIQGTAADLMKRAMLNVAHVMEKDKIDAPMILTVHDELVFEVWTEEVEKISQLVQSAMAEAIQLDVPLKVDVGWGRNWAEAHA